MEVILGEGLYLIELSPWGIGGQVCRKLHKSMFGSAISVKDMLLISISQEGFRIQSLVLGHLPNGVWT